MLADTIFYMGIDGVIDLKSMSKAVSNLKNSTNIDGLQYYVV